MDFLFGWAFHITRLLTWASRELHFDASVEYSLINTWGVESIELQKQWKMSITVSQNPMWRPLFVHFILPMVRNPKIFPNEKNKRKPAHSFCVPAGAELTPINPKKPTFSCRPGYKRKLFYWEIRLKNNKEWTLRVLPSDLLSAGFPSVAH